MVTQAKRPSFCLSFSTLARTLSRHGIDIDIDIDSDSLPTSTDFGVCQKIKLNGCLCPVQNERLLGLPRKHFKLILPASAVLSGPLGLPTAQHSTLGDELPDGCGFTTPC